MEDRDLIAFARQAIAELRMLQGQSLELLREANELRRLMDEMDRPLIGPVQQKQPEK
jgi:hypothetical protein